MSRSAGDEVDEGQAEAETQAAAEALLIDVRRVLSNQVLIMRALAALLVALTSKRELADELQAAAYNGVKRRQP